MVLWEITLGTAYFLGLKRTYRLALKIQRRLISPKRPKVRQFVHRRTRTVFDVALKFHRNVQERDIEVGRNLGNWILRWLDKMKPSAEIRGPSAGKQPPSVGSLNTSSAKQLTNSSHQKTPGGFKRFNAGGSQESDRHLFTSSRSILPKPFPAIAMMMRPANPAGNNIQHRHLSIYGPESLKLSHGRLGFDANPTGSNIQYRHLSIDGPESLRLSYGRLGFEGGIRKDIMQWMLMK